jgi:hypothetical protein
MLTSGNLSLSPLTVESSLAPASASAGDVFIAPDTRRAVAYIELPDLAPKERVKYEPVLNRDLPQDFDHALPLSDRVIIGEYRDDTILWYYVENADGVAHRVSVLLIASCLLVIGLLPSKSTQFEASAFAEAFPCPVSEYSEQIAFPLSHTLKENRSLCCN